MDHEIGMGTHWIALAFTPGTIFYYDPLLPNKDYDIPVNMRHFFESYQRSGGKLIMNLDADQYGTHAGIQNDMCGAYSALALLEVDREPTAANFYNIHDKLRNFETVKLQFDLMKH